MSLHVELHYMARKKQLYGIKIVWYGEFEGSLRKNSQYPTIPAGIRVVEYITLLNVTSVAFNN
jgi:hypothetical protein